MVGYIKWDAHMPGAPTMHCITNARMKQIFLLLITPLLQQNIWSGRCLRNLHHITSHLCTYYMFVWLFSNRPDYSCILPYAQALLLASTKQFDSCHCVSPISVCPAVMCAVRLSQLVDDWKILHPPLHSYIARQWLMDETTKLAYGVFVWISSSSIVSCIKTVHTTTDIN